MSLDLRKLEGVRELPSGIVQARCPACAEEGHDRKGEHLRIFADGRFGCCICPNDKPHRQRIFALAGNMEPGSFEVRVHCGQLSKVAASSVKDLLKSFDGSAGTVGTAKADSGNGVPSVPSFVCLPFGTLGTGNSKPYACARGDDTRIGVVSSYTHKDSENGVPSVPSEKPHLLADGTLVIPFDSPERFHWWKGGQSVKATLAELRKERHDTTV